MRIKHGLLVLFCAVAMPLPSFGQPDKLGKVTFPTSCDAKVQAQFERGVAMLHSFWFAEARKTFEAAATADPACGIAYWGVAMSHFGNPMAGGSAAAVAMALAARNGLRIASTKTLFVKRRREVRAAHAAMATHGSTHGVKADQRREPSAV